MTPEGKVKEAVKKVLHSFRDLRYEMPVPSGYARWGLDFNCYYRGIPFVIETKAHNKKPTIRQKATIESYRRAGVTVFVIAGASSPVFTDLHAFLMRIKRERVPTTGALYPSDEDINPVVGNVYGDIR